MKTKNIVISGTNFWNPGDDFVRDGVIRILRRLFKDCTLNFLFYNFNQDFYPQSKFSGIHNMAAAGDLEKYRESIDAVVVAGLSAGNEIKDLYRWIIENGLLDRVYLIGAGYENTYVEEHIRREPEATVFKHARIITGRTEKRPSFITEHGLPYHHVSCPAMLSVESVKNISVQANIRTIGFSIQLPHGVGVPNHCCDGLMYKLAAHTLLELFPKYRVEIVAHHKQEYFHFLNLVKGHDIPVFFSSFYQDLYDIYRRFDVVISTRLHACIYANSHGIPGIIVNDTDRHTHCARGFPHLAWVNTREMLHQALESICRQDLRRIAKDNKEFKDKLMQEYLTLVAGPLGIDTHSPVAAGRPRMHPNSKAPADKDEITSRLFNSVCHDTDVKRRVLQTISQLTKDAWLERNIEMFKAAIDSRASWFDALSFLNWYAANFKPGNYLEVGVRRGRSLVQVLTQSPETDAYGFDIWIPEYADAANPGPGFVISELNRLGVRNLPTLVAGDSHETLPTFWSDTHNPRQFDLIFVDGDHTYAGAKNDLEICFAHLAPGGVLVFDDIHHPSHPYLKDLWEEYKNKLSDYIFIEHSHGCGIGVAFKPPFDKLRTYLGIGGQEVKSGEPNAARVVRKKDEREDQTASALPIHFLTIVLNGQPFIRHHIDIFKQLPFKWHWHIVEGLADLKHDTAWSLELGGRISEQLHRNGLSNDGTTEYIDELARHYPANITVYCKPAGAFWDGKLEMVNAPLAGINEPCLLWQVDSDELWTAEQICTARDMFVAEPDRTAAYYLDHFFVGENLVTTTIDTYGNNTGYEWLRTWRFRPGFRWAAHEPPRLGAPAQDGGWVDVATIRPFKHAETAAKNLVFQHYAYATAKQLAFKETYYGYSNAVAQWQRLQQQTDFPVMLKNYFAWVKDEAQVNTIHSQNIKPLAWKDGNDQWRFRSRQQTSGQQPAQSSKDHKKILIVRPDAIGDFVIFSGVLERFRNLYKDAEISILTQEHVVGLAQSCPYVDDVIGFDRTKVGSDQPYCRAFLEHLKAKKFDVAINPVYSRDAVSDSLTLGSGAKVTIASKGDTSNMSELLKQENDRLYTKILPASDAPMLETERNAEFVSNLAPGDIGRQCVPKVWMAKDDETKIEELLDDLDVEKPIVICPFSQRAIKNWPLSKWIQLVRKYRDYPVVFCGSQKDTDRTNRLINALNHRDAHNLCGRITLRQLGALLERSRLCVGVDTATIHIAAAVGCPHVVIVGGGHFGRFVPYSPDTTLVHLPMKCYHCNWRCKYSQAHCITQIRVETVDMAVRQAVNNSKAMRSKPTLIEETLKSDLMPLDPVTWNREELADVDANEVDKDNKYLVTAIVSTYNAERFIVGRLEDLENQTMADRLEIIVVNSGSLENEETIVREYQQKYQNIVYIKTEQREGIYSAWNRAVKVARGEFLTNANTDDRYRPDALEIMAKALQENPGTALVYGDQICTDTPNDTFAGHHGTEMLRRSDYSRERLLLGCCVGSQPMWRKSLHDEFGYFDESLDCAGDWDFWIRISSKYEFRRIPEFLGLYYYNQTGIEHGHKIHSLYERYIVGRRYGTEYIAVIPYCKPQPGDPLVSVVVPVYNGADYIGQAIESVLIQSYPRLELIIVDDGSTDATRQVIQSYNDERIRYFRQDNSGVSCARNNAIHRAAGQYIMPLDADDMMAPEFITKHLQEFERHPDADLVYCDVLLIDENDKPLRDMKKPEYRDRRHMIRDLFRAGHPVVPFRLGIRRSVFDEIGFYDETLIVGEDYDMMRRFVKAGLKAHHLGEPLHLRRMQANSLTRTPSVQKAQNHFSVVRRFWETFTPEELFPDVHWNTLPADGKLLQAKCLIVSAYLAMGQDFVKSNAPNIYIKLAFEEACSQLRDCLEIDPGNWEIRQLLDKCERGGRKYDQGPGQAVARVYQPQYCDAGPHAQAKIGMDEINGKEKALVKR